MSLQVSYKMLLNLFFICGYNQDCVFCDFSNRAKIMKEFV